ncbi:hypothetical protein CDCA_CDCA10G2949 [Cyanidium caldarium]|uniref:SAM-dependent MTase RsmB/NOP-type domain-containing protein n=1 Tax=Cyanidium caldarium TaxID=2771 RepID=A0AAV9IXC5_CYACA|nr:hypothetical protein CDCA_CDCA10G2949 [Cyanidium caldarium]
MHQTYRDAAQVLACVARGQGSLKQVLYAQRVRLGRRWRAVYALATETYRHQHELERWLRERLVGEWRDDGEVVQAAVSGPERSAHWLLFVVLNEWRYGRGRLLPARGARTRRWTERLQGIPQGENTTEPSEEATAHRKRRVDPVETAAAAPRTFLCVNRLRYTPGTGGGDAPGHVDIPPQTVPDAHWPQYIWRSTAPRAQLLQHPRVRDISWIVQDKGACMAVIALDAQPGWHVVDACAAPGNKSIQLAGSVGAHGRVDAFERDPQRCALLRQRVGAAGAAAIVHVHSGDFLAAHAEHEPRWATAEAVVVDPTCSGSGRAEERPIGEEYDQTRLVRLAAFQTRLLCHALTAFPHALRVVYSTCSVFERENEQVVAAALAHPTVHSVWQLAPALPSWPIRGCLGMREAVRVPAYAGRATIRADVTTDSEYASRSAHFIALLQRRTTGV